MADLYVARQPNFDRNLSVVGYDLLYRSGAATTVADVTDDEVATSRVVYNTLVELDTSSAGRDLVSGRLVPANRLAVLQLVARLQRPGTRWRTPRRSCATTSASATRCSWPSARVHLAAPPGGVHPPGGRPAGHAGTAEPGHPGRPGQAGRQASGAGHHRPARRGVLGLAPATQLDLADAAFTTGLLSVLDTFMHTTLEEAAARLPLSAEVEQALVNRVGRLGAILEAVLSYEQGDLAGPDPFPLPVGTLRDAYLHAVSSATQVTAALS